MSDMPVATMAGGDTMDGAGAGEEETPSFNVIEGTARRDYLIGTPDADSITGGDDADIIDGRAGKDDLVGGDGLDTFLYDGNVLLEGGDRVADPVTGILVKDVEDHIRDFKAGDGANHDVLSFNVQSFGLDVGSTLKYREGAVETIQDGNLLVLTGRGFADPTEAAAAVQANNAVTADEGFIVFFDDSEGYTHIVFSEDLSDGGALTVVTGMTNLDKVASAATLSEANFMFT